MKSGSMCISDLYKMERFASAMQVHSKYIYRLNKKQEYNFTAHKCYNKALCMVASEYHNILENDCFDIDVVLNIGAFPYLKKRLTEKSKAIVPKRQSAYVEHYINKNDSAKESTSEVLLDIMNLTDRYIFNNREKL